MLPVIAIIGRPNVGKSTLFNRLIGWNKALTHDLPGVTRDRIHGESRKKGHLAYSIVDTGGLVLTGLDGFEHDVVAQAAEALAGADLALFVVDAREGLTPADQEAAEYMRSRSLPMLVVVNKVDGYELEPLTAEFHALGFDLLDVSAAHGHNIPTLRERIDEMIEALGPGFEDDERDDESAEGGLRLAMLGRPNAGKSSMVNALMGEDRLIVSPQAGTTRDSVDVTFESAGRRYTFIDTAGVRRKVRITESLERFSSMRALTAAKRAQVAVLVLDAVSGLTMQDKRLLSFLDREKTPFLVAVNKIDLVPRNKLRAVKESFGHELRICPHVPVVYTSCISKAGLGGLLPLAGKIWDECGIRLGTGELNRAMRTALDRHQPPVVKRRRAKFYYLTQPGTHPPTFVFFVNDPAIIKPSYGRYLENQLRKLLGISSAPLKIHYRSSHGDPDKKGKGGKRR